MHITYEENALTASQFQIIRESTGRKPIPLIQIENAINCGLYNVLAKHSGQPIGMGRLVGDGSMYWYIQDFFINPLYQGCGIGKTILNFLEQHIESAATAGTTTTVGLFAAIGKDGFYEKFGYTKRPSDIYGAGMIKHISC